MNHPGFIQIHFLTSYPASLLNRDDAGLAKRVPFGGAGCTRIRISSQCLKRHWRRFDGDEALQEIENLNREQTTTFRSQLTFKKFIYERLLHGGISEPMAKAVTLKLSKIALGNKEKGTGDGDDQPGSRPKDKDPLATPEITVLGRPELDFLFSEARAVCEAVPEAHRSDPKALNEAFDNYFGKEKGKGKESRKNRLSERRKNLEALKLGAGLDAALFGRMIPAGDALLARCDSAIHVAHAFTVDVEEAEPDFFTAVDDLTEALGGAHLNQTELTSGLFYGYVVADLRQSCQNLSHDRELAAEVLRRLVHIIATVSPGAKLGSTAPYSYARLVLVECATAQPRTLANAFLKPVDARGGDLLGNTYTALAGHLGELDGAYGKTDRRVLALGPKANLAAALPDSEFVATLSELADWTASRVLAQCPASPEVAKS